MNEKLIEKQSLQDLHQMSLAIEPWKMNLVLIGGYAVAAYTNNRRFTKDIDFVVQRTDLGKFTALVKQLGYQLRERHYWIQGKKTIDEQAYIEFHTAIDRVKDIRSKTTIEIDKEFIEKAQTKKIPGYYEENKTIKVKTLTTSPEYLLLMKIITLRPKDLFDATSLLLDTEINFKEFKYLAQKHSIQDKTNYRLKELYEIIKQEKEKEINQALTTNIISPKTLILEEIKILKEKIQEILTKP